MLLTTKRILLFSLIISLTGCLSFNLPEPEKCIAHDDCDDDEVCEEFECHQCGDALGRPCCRDLSCEEGFGCFKGECKFCGTINEHCCPTNSCSEIDLFCDEDNYCRIKPGTTAGYGSGPSRG